MAFANKKRLTTEEKEACRMITPEFRVSFPHVFMAQAPKPTDKKKFSVTALFPKDSDLVGVVDDVAKVPRSLKEVIKNAKLAAFGPKENWPEDLESPVSDGDDARHHKSGEKAGYRGHWVIKFSTGEDQRPSVVDEEGMQIPPEQAHRFYAGCYARAYVYAYAWEYMGRQGIGFILDHVQKLRDGEAFGGKKPVSQVFGRVASAKSVTADEGDEMDFR